VSVIFDPPLTQRISDVTVAEAISAEAGTEEASELFELSTTIVPVIPLQPRPPLAVSGYYPGLIGGVSTAVALNTSHVGIVVSTGRNLIVRVNFIIITNATAGQLGFELRRQDPATGFTVAPRAPGYINAGPILSGAVQFAVRSNTVAAQGTLMADGIVVEAASSLRIPGPFILNDGAISINPDVVNTTSRAFFGYEAWPAARTQRAGG